MHTHLELRQLRYFVAVAEALSFRRAAERMALTQPPLTRQIQALEQSLGVQLLVRDRRGVELTAEGEVTLRDARELLAQADALTLRFRRQASSVTGARSALRLGLTTVVDAALFTWLEPALRTRVPDLRLSTRRQISQRSISDLLRGRLDAALIGLPSETFDLVIEKLTDDPLMVALPGNHPLAKLDSLALRDLGAGPLFWFQRSLNPAYYDHFETLFRRLGFAPERLREPHDHHVLLSLIADGQGQALVPRSLTVVRRAGVVYKHLKDEHHFQIGLALAYPTQGQHPGLQDLRSVLRERYR